MLYWHWERLVVLLMRVPKVYLETSVFNFCFADDAPDKRQDTLTLFEEIKDGKYVPYTSAYVLQELTRAEEPKQGKMVALIDEYEMRFLEQSVESDRLAQVYVSEGIIPAKHLTDALHIATATVHDLDFIVSYNFQHIVKRKTVTMTEVVNLREGYKRIGIFSPTEVIENDE
jgi:predicted nucleic acid-binding protein